MAARSRALDPHRSTFVSSTCESPPNLGIITLNGLRISKWFLIPTIPDILSTYGIPQILKRVKDFSEEIAEDIMPLGIAITKYQSNSTVHNHTIQRLRNQDYPAVFSTAIPQANQLSGAAEFGGSMTIGQKWGYRGTSESYRSLTQEVLSALNGE